jgi:hypothetical protein
MRRRLRMARSLGAALLLLASAAGAQVVRDPMRPPDAAPTAVRRSGPATLKLEGVIAGAMRVAIVNGRLVHAGDQVAGVTIVEVLANGVRYSRAGRIQTLVLPGVHAIATVRVVRSSEATKP